ncbi:unnamed protein product (macronuclear) [Paramecium tetraurelia]|uniref:Transmembrane protein n=1 Tax=Paramecium tetraurelia TaxID=5888 RepID=A0DNC0_PARTE|nr:uncharacterized protein GSPATT00018732001 [Paramecium tetraurelia]CAK84537.1 unnamed protein product [Paramecium tetraurelia]|eukprot:XP_001451934.1 hypothetical protein (macronuclear) [Paramecium tetraurelia strain d4-2]
MMQLQENHPYQLQSLNQLIYNLQSLIYHQFLLQQLPLMIFWMPLFLTIHYYSQSLNFMNCQAYIRIYSHQLKIDSFLGIMINFFILANNVMNHDLSLFIIQYVLQKFYILMSLIQKVVRKIYLKFCLFTFISINILPLIKKVNNNFLLTYTISNSNPTQQCLLQKSNFSKQILDRNYQFFKQKPMKCPNHDGRQIELICLAPHKCNRLRKLCIECIYDHGVDWKLTIPIKQILEKAKTKLNENRIDDLSKIIAIRDSFKFMMSKTENTLQYFWGQVTQQIELTTMKILQYNSSYRNLVVENVSLAQSTSDDLETLISIVEGKKT